MPDEVVTSAPEISQVAKPAVAEAPKPAAAKAQPNESFTEKMERLGWQPETKHDENPNALGSKAREAEKKQKPAGKPRAHASEENAEISEKDPKKPDETASTEESSGDPLAAKREQLKSLIGELGLMLEDGRVTSKERAEIRVARKQLQEQLAAREGEAMKRIEAATKALEEREGKDAPRLAKLAEFDAAVASGDHEAFAKLAGFENYDKFQEHVIALKQDPAYRRLRELEERDAARTKAEKDRAEREEREGKERTANEERQRAQATQAENQRVYLADLSSKMASHEDPLMKAMADDPAFVQAVARAQWNAWDGVSQTVIDPLDAVRRVNPGEKQSLYQQLEGLYRRISPIFSSAPAPAAARPAQAAAATPEAKKPRAPAAPKPPPPSVKKLDDREWRAQATARLAEAAREEAMGRRRVS